MVVDHPLEDTCISIAGTGVPGLRIPMKLLLVNAIRLVVIDEISEVHFDSQHGQGFIVLQGEPLELCKYLLLCGV